jgi:23S rRNA (pseudouridine1915-N3)-methyltransferase
MKLVVLSVGKSKDKNIAQLVEMYVGRIIPKGSVEVEFVGSARDGNIEKEGVSILKRLRERDTVILLDEHGKMYDSVGFSDYISKLLSVTEGRLVFIIGGAFGLSSDVRKRAEEIISLSKMTFPHELCLLFLSEQLYRAFSIIAGTDYHHI